MSSNKDDRYKHPAVLLEYFRRIGAEVLNFRRAMVKEHRGAYYVERTLIKITAEGEIECSRKEHRPSKEEADAIKEALKGCEFPKSIGATEASVKELIKHRGGDPSNFFAMHDRRSGKITMVQERVDVPEEGTKFFRPHTLWSDNVWRTLEPESKLPFWKPREKRNCPRIMVHEGAKKGWFVDWLINDRSPAAKKAREAHPWTEELERYEHWGMIGGALAPQRSDYSEIKSEQPIEVVYVCDNDWPGRDALKKFSFHYKGPLKGVQFHQTWPESWDMANEIPAKLFHKGLYIGPSLKSLMIPATWATDMIVPSSGKGSMAVLRDDFIKEWLHSVTPEAFIHKEWANDILNEAEFNNRVRPFSNVYGVSKLLIAESASKSRRLHYLPGEPSGLMGNSALGAFINTYCPSAVKADPKATEEDWKPFLDFMEILIPEENDRIEVLRWCATLIAKPSVKMTYGLLLISEAQGVGKTTLGEKILTPLVGEDNVSAPSESDIVESQFNGWIAHKRLAIVNEIYAGASTKAYNKLKSVITDKRITVNRKHQATYEIENWLHVFACSNSARALKLSIDDRRWFVPKVTEEIEPPVYWATLNQWLANEGGLQKIAAWAKMYVMDVKSVREGEPAPDSEAKRAMIEESMSPGQIIVADTLDFWREKFKAKHDAAGELIEEKRKVFTTDLMLVSMIKSQLYEGRHSDKLEKASTVRKLAKSRGWFIGDRKTALFEPKGGQARIIANDEQLTKMDPAELAKIYDNPLGFNGEDVNV